MATHHQHPDRRIPTLETAQNRDILIRRQALVDGMAVRVDDNVIRTRNTDDMSHVRLYDLRK